MTVRNRSWMLKRKGHDSLWEKRLNETILKDCKYHPETIPYIIEKTYEPDWKIGNIYIEAKGIFVDSPEAAKYKWVRDHLPEGTELVFLFQKPENKLLWAKKRKDGTFMNHSEWAEYHNFRWFTEQTIGEIL